MEGRCDRGAGGVALEFGVGVLAGDPTDDGGGEEKGEEDCEFEEVAVGFVLSRRTHRGEYWEERLKAKG